MLLSLLTKRQSPATARYDWILAITFIAYCFSAFGNGANDVANAYATSVAARTLSMVQVGFLSIITEFFGAVVLGERVTDTIKNGISKSRSVVGTTSKADTLLSSSHNRPLRRPTWSPHARYGVC